MNPFNLFALPYGWAMFAVLLIVVLMLGLTVARIANRQLNPESAALDKRPIGSCERWLERLLTSSFGKLILSVIFVSTFPVAAIGTRASWEAGFRALDSGQIATLRAHSLIAGMYRTFGLNGAIFAIRFVTVTVVLNAIMLISQRFAKFREERRAELAGKNTDTSQG